MVDRNAQYDEAIQKAKALFLERNKEYGDAIVYGGVEGAMTELIGVVARLRQVLRATEGRSLSEVRRDAILYDKLIDGVNYCVIGLMMLEENNITGINFPEECSSNDCEQK